MGARLLLGVASAVLLVLIGINFWISREAGDEPGTLRPFAVSERPQADRYLFDYAGTLAHYEEGAHLYLGRLRERFHIESLIVALPAMPDGYVAATLAAELVNRWRIGGANEGRGLLLLLVEADKQVKLEVTYELEDVFTDAFSGFVEDLQLRPYYLAGDIGTGLIAVMEELERRARIKEQGDYTPGMIARLDDELLSGGAGAGRGLERYEPNGRNAPAPVTAGRAAASPAEAWEIMLRKWAGDGATIDVDVYTELTRMAMGDPNHADARTRRAVPHWRSADYRVLQDTEHAVIWFGAIDGWNNAPFLFCRTDGGWKFDIVHQRRLVVMAEEPKWMIEQGAYPYVALLAEARQSTGKDLPLDPADRYRCRDDARIAGEIQLLERAQQAAPDDVGVLLPLARLNVITGRRPNHVHPLLARLKELDPRNPEVWKYSAIYNVNSFFQYRTALREMETYTELRPRDAFGHNFVGFLYYRLGDYESSIESLTTAVALQPDNAYAYALLARDYALLYRNTTGEARRQWLREQSLAMLDKAASAPTPDPERIARLRSWLDGRLR